MSEKTTFTPRSQLTQEQRLGLIPRLGFVQDIAREVDVALGEKDDVATLALLRALDRQVQRIVRDLEDEGVKVRKGEKKDGGEKEN